MKNTKINLNLNHYLYYLILVMMLVLGVSLFYFFRGLPDIQFKIIILLSFFYFLWGNVFHCFEGDFHLKVMIEYLLIAFLVIILGYGIIFH